MRVVIAPDKFAGTLTAAEAAAAMAAGWRDVRPDDDITVVPMADGGEGTLAVVAEAVPAARRHGARVADARGRAVDAEWLLLPDGRALVEAAAACGLARLAEDERDPLTATSYGAGQLVAAALAAGARQVVVGLGGSATVDGGAGLAIALGHRLLRKDGNGLKVGAQHLVDLHRLAAAAVPDAEVVVASDVTNPLLGPDGAAPVFGPQKGASDDDVALLEGCLRHWADVVERDAAGGPWRDLPGAGAAGGLGFALAALCGARLDSGAAAVASLTGLDDAVREADVVLTGEGKLDAQTAHGKAPGLVAERGRDAGARVGAVAGRLADGAGADYDVAVDLGPEGMQRAAELVRERTATVAKELS